MTSLVKKAAVLFGALPDCGPIKWYALEDQRRKPLCTDIGDTEATSEHNDRSEVVLIPPQGIRPPKRNTIAVDMPATST